LRASTILAIDLGVDDRVLGDFIVVIGIVRCVLVAPFDLAVAGIDGEHARRPFIVARPVFGIPVRPGIADALVERVALGIIGRGLPYRAAATPGGRLGIRPRPFLGRSFGRLGSAYLCGTGGGLLLPSSRATAKRLTRMIIGVVVFAVGVLAGVGIASMMMPPA
jgi:hypothetical protein